jgi:hypothetical protein
VVIYQFHQAKDVLSSPSVKLLSEYDTLRCAWVESCRLLSHREVLDRTVVSHTAYPVRSSSSADPTAFSLGMAAMQRLGAICLEQDRMREQIIAETCSVLGAAVKRAADSLTGIQSDSNCRHSVKTVGQVVSSFRRHSVSVTE